MQIIPQSGLLTFPESPNKNRLVEIPFELVHRVLSYFPAKNLFSFKVVNKIYNEACVLEIRIRIKEFSELLLNYLRKTGKFGTICPTTTCILSLKQGLLDILNTFTQEELDRFELSCYEPPFADLFYLANVNKRIERALSPRMFVPALGEAKQAMVREIAKELLEKGYVSRSHKVLALTQKKN